MGIMQKHSSMAHTTISNIYLFIILLQPTFTAISGKKFLDVAFLYVLVTEHCYKKNWKFKLLLAIIDQNSGEIDIVKFKM